MKSLPCARHPLNHALVQELALHAALSETHTVPAIARQDTRAASNDLWAAAAQWADSALSAQEALTYGRTSPLRPRSSLAALSLVQHHVSSFSESSADALPWMGPERLVPLYAPRAVLASLPHHVHDPVLYDQAVQHQRLLTRLVAPYGVQVWLCGLVRRGCPVGHRVEVLLTLSAAAEAQLAEAEVAAKESGHVGQHSPLSSPHASKDARRTTREPGRASSAGRALGSETCSAAEAYATQDAFSDAVMFRYQRAVEGLAHAGYLVAGRAPSQALCAPRAGLPFTVRFDPLAPQQCPPHQLCSAPHLARLRLHRLIVHMAPRQAQVVRLFFLTGPAAYTSHVTLAALAKGYELNMNGLFVGGMAAEGQTSSSSSHARTRVTLRSEADLFRVLDLPYVDPVNRGIYCQVNKL